MNTVFFSALVFLQAAPPAELPRLTAEQSASIRCAAAFSLIAHGQSNGNEAALEWPAMNPRGREFFVRTAARLIDETGGSREQISQLIGREAQALVDKDEVQAVMPACLLMLEASGL